MAYLISKLILWTILSPFIKKIDGIDNLPDKPFILASNHQSYIDPILLITIIAMFKNKQICFFALKNRFTSPFWNTMFEHFGAIRVNGSLKKGIRALKQGNCVGIFPEGERTSTGDIQQIYHKGLGAMAKLTKAPVVPVYMQTFDFWNKDMLMPNLKKNITIKIGKPMQFRKTTIKEANETIWKEVKKLA